MFMTVITCHKVFLLVTKDCLDFCWFFRLLSRTIFWKPATHRCYVWKILKVFTTGTNRWDWHRTEHQQPTLEDGNLRWGENGHLFKWSSLEDADSLQVYHVINKLNLNPRDQSGVMSFSMIPLDDFGRFASYFGMMVWLVFQRLVTWYVNILMNIWRRSYQERKRTCGEMMINLLRNMKLQEKPFTKWFLDWNFVLFSYNNSTSACRSLVGVGRIGMYWHQSLVEFGGQTGSTGKDGNSQLWWP